MIMRKKTNNLIFPLLLMGVFLIFASSCKKGIPVLSTTAITDITQTTAKSGGNITSDGGATVTVRGVCWSTNQTPTISDNKTTDGTGAGNFVSSISGLTANTTYYVRAYATNSNGTAYVVPCLLQHKKEVAEALLPTHATVRFTKQWSSATKYGWQKTLPTCLV